MTGEDDTGQSTRLPLIERARLGLSIEETELTPEQIAALEFPKDGVGQSWWCGQIEQAIKAGELAAHVEKTVTVIRNGVRLTKKYRDGELSDSKIEAVSPSSREQDNTREKYFIPRDAYADWRTGAAVFRKPAESYIDLWLPPLPTPATEEATPASEVAASTELARLPLTERAKRGLLPKESELWLFEIMDLEFPTAISTQQKKQLDYTEWKNAIDAAIRFGILEGPYRQQVQESETYHFPDTSKWANFHPMPQTIHVMGYSDWRLPRESYRAWRTTQANPPTGSIIHLWLGATLTPPKSEPIHRQTTELSASGSRHPAEMRQCVTDKAQFLENATWQGTQQATVNNHPEASRFKARYDTPTLLRWISEIDPRPKDKRGGRPRKK